jgi:hypothetical protein
MGVRMKIRIVVGIILSIVALAGTPKKMNPCLYFVDDPLGSIRIDKDEIVVDRSVGKPISDSLHKDRRYVVYVGDLSVPVTAEDEAAGVKWMKDNDQRKRLTIKDGDLYLDGTVVDLGGAEVTQIFDALPWNNGVLCVGRTYRKKFKDRPKTLKEFMTIPPEEIEPYCAIWVNQATHKGKSLWLYGKVRRSYFVFPLPRK